MDTICVYKDKLNEALTLVPSMSQAKKIEAVTYWNNAATHFQRIVNANSPTQDPTQHTSDATGQDSSLDLDYQQQVSELNPPVILNSEEFASVPSDQVNPSITDNIVDLTSDLSPSDTPVEQRFQHRAPLSGSVMYGDEYFPANMVGEMQHLSPESNDINGLSTVCNSSGAEDTLQSTYMSNVMTTEDDCAVNRSLLTMDTCADNQQYGSTRNQTNAVALNNIVAPIASTSTGPIFCPMLDGPLQVAPIEASNDNCRVGHTTQRAQTTIVTDRGGNQTEMILCPSQTTITHDTGNGQFDRGPDHPLQTQAQGAQSTSNLDPCFSISTSAAATSRNNLYTQGARPLQQIQISGPSAIDCDSNADARLRSASIQQSQQRSDAPINVNQQIVYMPSSTLFTPPSCSSSHYNNPPQQNNPDIKMEDGNMVSCTHPTNEQHTCELCGKSGFSTKGNLKRHRKAHAGEKPYKCEHCDSKFTEKKSLKIHLRRHTGEKPYKCAVCEKPFSQTGVLKSHMALHLEERKFNCDKCNKAFRQRSQLKLHLMRHDGIKKLECSRCMAKFLTKGDLERHFRIHTGERPYRCNMCEKTFTRQQSLNEHKNRHIGRKPFTCKYCNKSFSEMSASYKHAKVHKKEEQARAIERVVS